MATVKTLIPKKESEEKRIRVAAYCRVSTDSADQKDSFDAQVEYYTSYIGENPSWTLADIYADQGISGTSMANREEFNRMIADCQRGKIDRIITKSVSRFARNTVDCLDTVRKLSELGISILFQKEQIDTSTMSSEFLLALTGVQAQNESVSISGNMRWSYEKRMRSGDFITCRAPYGYDLVNGALVINETEAQIVKEIFQMFLLGISKPNIAKYLNSHGILPKHEKVPWSAVTVRYILSNERYTGDALLQKKYTTDTFPYVKKKNNGERKMYLVENSHLPIISKEQYEVAKEVQRRRYPLKRKRPKHGLTGLLICQDCGKAFRRIQMNNKWYWRCANKGRGETDSNCHSVYLLEDDVCAALIRMINILRDNNEKMLQKAIHSLELLQAKATGTQYKVYEIDKMIAETKNQIHLLSQLQLQGILDPADFATQSTALNSKVSHLRSKRSELVANGSRDENIDGLRLIADMVSSLEDDLTFFDEDIIREVVKKVIVINSSELEIHLTGGLILDEHLPK